MAKKTIVIACKGSDAAPFQSLKEFQGNLKDLSTENYDKLKKEILELGFSEPISVWKNKGKLNIINGHQRLRVVSKMVAEGYECPDLPICEIEARNLKEAKLKVLALTSQYGEITNQGLYEFLNTSEISLDEIRDSFRFPEIDLEDFGEEFFGEGGGAGGDDLYTKKIEIPIYEPKSPEPPPLNEMVDVQKTEVLIKEIDKANIPDDVKDFLKFAANRHTVFYYDKIAEYYSHAPKSVQKLMEKSALVIIDFDKAIENGFTALSEKLAGAYKNEKTNS